MRTISKLSLKWQEQILSAAYQRLLSNDEPIFTVEKLLSLETRKFLRQRKMVFKYQPDSYTSLFKYVNKHECNTPYTQDFHQFHWQTAVAYSKQSITEMLIILVVFLIGGILFL